MPDQIDPLTPAPQNPAQLPGPMQDMVRSLLGGAAGHILSLPQQMFESSENMRLGGDYNPAPVVEGLGMLAGGGAPAARAMGSEASLAALGLLPRVMEDSGADLIWGAGRKGVHSFDIVNELNKPVARTWLTQPDPKTLHVEMIRALEQDPNYAGMLAHGKNVPNSLGWKEMRTLIPAIKQHFPEVEKVEGYRISGARDKARNEAEIAGKKLPDSRVELKI